MASVRRPAASLEREVEPIWQLEEPVPVAAWAASNSQALAADEMSRSAVRWRWPAASALPPASLRVVEAALAVPREPPELALASLADYPATPVIRRNAR